MWHRDHRGTLDLAAFQPRNATQNWTTAISRKNATANHQSICEPTRTAPKTNAKPSNKESFHGIALACCPKLSANEMRCSATGNPSSNGPIVRCAYTQLAIKNTVPTATV